MDTATFFFTLHLMLYNHQVVKWMWLNRCWHNIACKCQPIKIPDRNFLNTVSPYSFVEGWEPWDAFVIATVFPNMYMPELGGITHVYLPTLQYTATT